MLVLTILTYPHEKFDSYKDVPQSVCAVVYVWSVKVVGIVVIVVHLQDCTVSEGKKNCSWFAAICLHINDMRWGDGNEDISFILLPRQLLCFLQSFS